MYVLLASTENPLRSIDSQEGVAVSPLVEMEADFNAEILESTKYSVAVKVCTIDSPFLSPTCKDVRSKLAVAVN